MRKSQIVLALALVGVVSCLPFLSSLDNDLTNWDDDKYIIENHLVKNLSWSGIKEIFTSVHLGNYHPLVFLSYALEYALFGPAPFVYHLTNLLLHVGNSLLVFCFILQLSGQIPVALVTALLFGAHPLRVESVVWAAERKDVLSTLFFLGALLCYLRYSLASTQKSPPPWRGRIKEGGIHEYLLYTLSLLAFLLSLLSKPMAVTLPFVLLLCDYFAARAFSWHTLREKIPFFLLSITFGLIALFAQHSGRAINPTRSFALLDNILIACQGVLFYWSKTLVPLYLSALYPYPKGISILSPAFFLPLAVVTVVGGLVVFSQRYTRKVFFGTLFFLLTILPVLKLVPIGEAAVADRYMYIPSIGLFYLGGVAFYHYAWEARWQSVRRGMAVFFLGSVLLVFSVLTWQRCNVWQNSETLWQDVLAKYPDIPFANHNLGNVYSEKGRLDEAIAAYQKALAAYPEYAPAYNDLGVAYEKKGLINDAIAAYKKALAIDPQLAPAHNNLGNIYSGKGRLDDAIAAYHQALAIDPHYAPAHYNLGDAYERKGLIDDAIAAYQRVLAVYPYHALTHYRLGGAYIKKGLIDAAVAEYQKVLAINPRDTRAHYNLAVVYHHKGNYKLAIAHYDRALELGYPAQPRLAEALKPYR